MYLLNMDSAYNSMVSQQKATVRANRAPNGRYLSDICIGPKLALEAMRNIERCGTLELDELDGAEPEQNSIGKYRYYIYLW